MKGKLIDLYYVIGVRIAVMSSSPVLDILRKKSLEVLCMADPVDEFAVQQFKAFDEKTLKSTTNEGLHISITYAAPAPVDD